jgi:MoxR-like ATPase
MLHFRIPSEHRDAIRALIRSQAGYEAFRLANGAFKSRDITHTQTMLAIEALGIEGEVRSICAGITNIVRDAQIAAMIEGEAANDAAETASEAIDPVTLDPELCGQIAMLATPETETSEAETMANSVLDPLRPFLSPVILAQVSTALTPIVDRALKPVEIERTITVTLDAEGKAVAPAMPEMRPAKRVAKSTLGKLFSIPSSNRNAGYAVAMWDALDVLPPDPYFVAVPSTMAHFVTRAERGRAVWLSGPSGTGKSTMPQEYAARTGRPFVSISFQRAIDPLDLIGSPALDGKGGEKWRDGLLTRSIRRPGTVILLDEITSAPPGLLMTLQTLLSSRTLTLPTGERVTAADGVVFVAADNTAGYGDETGLYAVTMQMNTALVDRFALVIPVAYMSVAQETQALVNHTGAAKPACERVVKFVHSARKLPGFENWPLSLRRMVAFIEGLQDNFPPDEVFEMAFLTRLPTAEREALRMHFAATFVNSAIEAEMAGKAPAAPPSSDPAQVSARNAFDPVDGNN